MVFARSLVVHGLGGMMLLAAAAWQADASAQQIFRSTSPEGRVIFSDRPASDGAARPASAPQVPGGAAPAADASTLPYELRQAATRYPVTLHVGPECAPCAAARAMLVARGIPFAEKTVTTNEDIEALKRLAGTPTLPLALLGNQQLAGYTQQEWSQYLDAAGYPKTSQLPPGFQRPAPTPLAAVQPAKPAPKTPPATANAAPTPAPLPPAPAYNGGIRF